MTALRVLLSRLLAVVRQSNDAMLSEEIDVHLSMLEAEHVRRGLSGAEARAAARREFGGVSQVKEAHRDQRAVPLVDSLLQDLRYALRMMRRAPGFTAIAVLTLALGIGANAAIFGFLDLVLLQPPPVRDPDGLMRVTWTADRNPSTTSVTQMELCGDDGAVASGCAFSRPAFEQLRSTGGLAGLTAFAGPIEVSAAGSGSAAMASGYFVTGAFFDTLGVSTTIGRSIQEADDRAGAEPVVVLSHAYWTRVFGADARVIGQAVRINTVPFTVVGVAELRFTHLSPGFAQDFWAPLAAIANLRLPWLRAAGPLADDGAWWLELLGRVPAGSSVERAAAILSAGFTPLTSAPAKPAFATNAQPAIRLLPARNGLVGYRGDLSQPTRLIMGAVALILLTACANIAGLLLARNASRRQELAIRRSLGAGRARLVRQLLTESVLLSLAGGALGLIVARAGLGMLLAFLETGPFRDVNFAPQLDARFVTFVVLTSVAAGLLFGIAPALGSMTAPLVPALKQNSTAAFQGSGRRRFFALGRLLVIGQVTASALLLVVGGLLLRTVINLQHVDPGFNTRNLLLFGIDPGSSGYSPQQSQALFRNVSSSLAALPGVTAVTYSSGALLAGGVIRSNINLPDGSGRSVQVDLVNVGPDYFKTMGIPMLSGRALGPDDFTPPQGPAVVNRVLLRQLLGRSDRIDELRPDGDRALLGRPIVGIAADVSVATVRSGVRPTMYTPLRFSFFTTTFAVRTAGNPDGLVTSIRRVIAAIDPNLPVENIRTQEAVVNRQLFTERLLATAGALFAATGVVLVGIGVYGLLAYAVARRRREIGIRLALGATPRHLQSVIVGDSLLLAGAGIVVGIPLGLTVARLLHATLFGVSPMDPLSLMLAVGLIVLTALAAALVPAHRAAAVEPLEALRQE